MNKQHFDEIRMKKQVSLERLSELTLIPISTLAKISAGKIKTSFENMCRIANALECSLDDLADHVSSLSVPPKDVTFIKQYQSFHTQNLHGMSLPTIYHYIDIDFAWQITTNAYMPYFFQSDILLFQNQAPKPDDIALFQQEEHIFLCQYTIENHTELLKSVNEKNCSPEFWQKEKCRCLGTLHSIIRANSPLAEKINFKK